MTYCIGLQVDSGLVFLSDSRTNAGVDHINTFRKMTVLERTGDRVLVLLTSGNLAISQAVINELKPLEKSVLNEAKNMVEAARIVGDALRKVYLRDAEAFKEFGLEFAASFIFGGQIGLEPPALFQIYAAGNFIETTRETPYFQVGESKYGKPIIDRVVEPHTSLKDAAKCALISMDSTIRSNLSVGMPLDLLVYEANSLTVKTHVSIGLEDPYYQQLRSSWGDRLRQAFNDMPAPQY
ncbi:MAG: peptidase [Gammaproteobacteria bacterium]|nr:MAG: peptidase [Gammaproteobacteria bacterium]